jgi:hypothetical protein
MTEHTLTSSPDVHALRRAADSARDTDDHAAAIGHYGAALALLSAGFATTDPWAEYELRSGRAACAHSISDYLTESNDLAAMIGLAAKLGDTRRQIKAITRQAALADLLGNPAEASDAVEAALGQARELARTWPRGRLPVGARRSSLHARQIH